MFFTVFLIQKRVLRRKLNNTLRGIRGLKVLVILRRNWATLNCPKRSKTSSWLKKHSEDNNIKEIFVNRNINKETMRGMMGKIWQDRRCSLIGKIFIDRNINKETIRGMMGKSGRLVNQQLSLSWERYVHRHLCHQDRQAESYKR